MAWRYLFSQRLCIAAAFDPLEQRYRADAALRELSFPERRVACLAPDPAPAPDRNPVAAALMPSTRRVILHDIGAQADWMLMRTSVALAWYEAERRAPAARLEDLVPRYLQRLPECPFTGQPLRYREGKVWSLGRNGVDDGGKPGKGEDSSDDDGDVVWTVRRK